MLNVDRMSRIEEGERDSREIQLRCDLDNKKRLHEMMQLAERLEDYVKKCPKWTDVTWCCDCWSADLNQGCY